MNSFWDLFWITVLFFFMWRAYNKINDTLNLINDLSDDINDIKKKLGLRVNARTRKQKDESNRDFIWKSVMKGEGIKDLREIFGFWEFRKYKWYIESCLEDYPDRKICPECKRLCGKHQDGCYVCGYKDSSYRKLIPFKEFKEKHPNEEGWVEDDF